MFSWSGGKDSALALYSLRRNNPDISVTALLTTVTADNDRISMHGVRHELLEKQAASIGLPLEKVMISKKSSNEEYEERMKEVLLRYKAEGVTCVAFGDIFLEDLKRYRDSNLAKIGLKGISHSGNKAPMSSQRSSSNRDSRQSSRALIARNSIKNSAAGPSIDRFWQSCRKR